MTFWWRELALVGLALPAFGCSSSGAVQSSPGAGGHGGQAASGGRGGMSSIGSGGTGGSAGAGLGGAFASGGTPASAGSGRGGAFSAGAAGAAGATGGTSARAGAGGKGTAGSAGMQSVPPPAGWTCDPATYGDGACNCGCGVLDIDCPDAKASSCDVCDETSCWPLHCDKVEADDNTHCSAPPPAWNCSARLYHDGTRCDCGCGAVDPDCASPDIAACDNCDSPGSCSAQPCPSIIDPASNGRCDQPPAPPGWTCQITAYGDGLECDCGCGVPDIDCRNSDFETCERCLACGGHGACEGTVDPMDTTQCAPPPAGWVCSADEWRDAICDCGCGIPDVYCQGIELSYVCGAYPVDGCSAGDKSHIDPNHNELCVVNVPSEWTCDRSYYFDGFCDCGCGAVDLDCATGDVAACEQCNDDGSCSTAACPGTISANDSAHCSK